MSEPPEELDCVGDQAMSDACTTDSRPVDRHSNISTAIGSNHQGTAPTIDFGSGEPDCEFNYSSLDGGDEEVEQRPKYYGPLREDDLEEQITIGLVEYKDIRRHFHNQRVEAIAPGTTLETRSRFSLFHCTRGNFFHQVWTPGVLPHSDDYEKFGRRVLTAMPVFTLKTRACHVPTDAPLSRRKKELKARLDSLITHAKCARASEAHYTLRWPPLGALEIPKPMIDRLEGMRMAYPREPLCLNYCVAAVIIYFDLIDEVCERVLNYLDGEGCIPMYVDVTTFVIYFAHWLKFTEDHALPRHPHPIQFASIMRDFDDMHGGLELDYNFDHLSSTFLKNMYDSIVPRTPMVSAKDRVCLLPASFPGTKLPWPHGAQAFQPPSIGLHAYCLLNDIAITGLPGYSNVSCPQLNVALPPVAAQTLFRGQQWPVQTVSNALAPAKFWESSVDNAVALAAVSLSKDTLVVGPIFTDVNEAKDLDICSFTHRDARLRRENELVRIIPNAVLPRSLELVKKRNIKRLLEARKLRIPLAEIDIDEEGCLCWDGLEMRHLFPPGPLELPLGSRTLFNS